MEKKIIETNLAPAPIGPYSQAVQMGNILFTSGQIALDPVDGTLYKGDIKIETQKVLDNLANVLKAAGMDFSNVMKVSIFLLDMGQFPIVNEVYKSYFPDNYPARETVQVTGLPKGANVEISVIAMQ